MLLSHYLQVMYDATGVRLHAGRQAEVRSLVPLKGLGCFFCSHSELTFSSPLCLCANLCALRKEGVG